MSINDKPKVAIINYGLGNLFSIKQACAINGLDGVITFEPEEILSAQAVILPGVGAFGSAMEALRRLQLIRVLKEFAASLKPFVGICLGMQLLLDKSYEFGEHQGLGIIKGLVVPFRQPKDDSGRILKVPQVGWNTIYKTNLKLWDDSFLKDVSDQEFMYFVHSFYVKMSDSSICLSLSRYGDVEFCSSFKADNIFACQFHPERSGPEGLKVYKQLATAAKQLKRGAHA